MHLHGDKSSAQKVSITHWTAWQGAKGKPQGMMATTEWGLKRSHACLGHPHTTWVSSLSWASHLACAACTVEEGEHVGLDKTCV
jgi:hypothetical protein